MKDKRQKKLNAAYKRMQSCKPLTNDEVYRELCANRDHCLLEMRRYILSGGSDDYTKAKGLTKLLNHALHAVQKFEEAHTANDIQKIERLEILIPGLDYDLPESDEQVVN